jgi:hypothetical protein
VLRFYDYTLYDTRVAHHPVVVKITIFEVFSVVLQVLQFYLLCAVVHIVMQSRTSTRLLNLLSFKCCHISGHDVIAEDSKDA